MRRIIALLAVAVLPASLLVVRAEEPALATPVATTEAVYQAYGRVFPDPHGCVRGQPGTSPFAKGDVCATQFMQFGEALDGLAFLEARFPRYVEVINLREEFGDEFPMEELQSAGIPREDLTRDRSDLRVVKVTDAESPVPEEERRHFAYSLSIHGIERAGIEGGIRAVEDLVTWAACERDAEAAPACAAEGISPESPRPILEPSDSGPTASQVMTGGVVYFVLSNPDGWRRGDVVEEGGLFFERYNGNGMDMNRDWPTIGYTEAQYTPWSEPETSGYGTYLRSVRDDTAQDAFAGAIDLHGMVTAPSFSFTLLGAGQRDYRKNQRTVDTSILTFRDAEQRLTWSELIAPADECPGTQVDPVFGGTLPMCADQWGTVWDTINYQVTGSFGDWMDSPIGLDGVGIDNEMALSHLAPNNIFIAEVEQLHIDGNKGLIYSQIASLLSEEEVELVPDGDVAYVMDPQRTTDPGGEPVESPVEGLPTQDAFSETSLNGIENFDFFVEGPQAGVYNGGLTIQATFGNGRGISGGSQAELSLLYCGPDDHPSGADTGPECQEVAQYFNQSAIYAQAGARIDLDVPRPGAYRIEANPARTAPTRFDVSFSEGPPFPQPEQAPYDVSRMDFFTELNDFVPEGRALEAVTVEDVMSGVDALEGVDTLVLADDFMPGYVSPEERREQEASVPGEPQPSEEFMVTPAPTGIHEFTVDDSFDNDEMVVRASWDVASDFDVHVEYLNPETEEYEERGCECAFVNNGEQVDVVAPEPGQWRVRVENFAAAPQQVEGMIAFATAPALEVEQSRYSAEEFERYAASLEAYTRAGGTLVLTDSGLEGLPALGTGLTAEDVVDGVYYAGWMDFDDGEGETYDRHPLAAGVNKEGTAEGVQSVDGNNFEHRHQTYEPTPLGYYVSPTGAGNSACRGDRCDSPNWIVDREAWEAAGGTTAARTLVRETVSPGSPSSVGTSLGQLELGDGRVRIAGALLPEPTEANFHPYGLSSYALTYTGYQVFENLLEGGTPGDRPRDAGGGGTGPGGTDPDGTGPGGTGPGGTDPGGIEDAVNRPGDSVLRVAGGGRIETAIELSREAFPDGAERVVLARADEFPDALTSSTLAAEVDGPILLTGSERLDAQTAAELERLDPGLVYLAGGVDALSADVEADVAALEVATQRLGGADRFVTAALIAGEVAALGGPVDQAIVARADDFADALAAGNLATAGRAPILLTTTTDLPDVTLDALGQVLDGEDVFVAGGVAAVAEGPEAELGAAGYDVARRFGADRYGTAVALVDEAVAQGASRQPMLLASGADFPDALAAVPVAHAFGGSLLLVHPEDLTLSPATADYLRTHADEIRTAVFAGGVQAVSDRVADQVREAIAG